MHLSVEYSSTMRIPSTETTKGDKWWYLWRQDSRYFFFFSFSDIWGHFYSDLFRWEKASVLTICMSCIHCWIFARGPRRMGLSLPHGIYRMGEGFAAHMWGCEGFSCDVSDPITELVVIGMCKFYLNLKPCHWNIQPPPYLQRSLNQIYSGDSLDRWWN